MKHLTVRVSAKGRVTIPKALRDRLDLRAGESLEIVIEGGQLIIARHATRDDPVDQAYGAITLNAPSNAIVRELR